MAIKQSLANLKLKTSPQPPGISGVIVAGVILFIVIGAILYAKRDTESK